MNVRRSGSASCADATNISQVRAVVDVHQAAAHQIIEVLGETAAREFLTLLESKRHHPSRRAFRRFFERGDNDALLDSLHDLKPTRSCPAGWSSTNLPYGAPSEMRREGWRPRVFNSSGDATPHALIEGPPLATLHAAGSVISTGRCDSEPLSTERCLGLSTTTLRTAGTTAGSREAPSTTVVHRG